MNSPTRLVWLWHLSAYFTKELGAYVFAHSDDLCFYLFLHSDITIAMHLVAALKCYETYITLILLKCLGGICI